MRASRATVGWVLGIHLAFSPSVFASDAAETPPSNGAGPRSVREVYATAYAVADDGVVFTVAIEETWDRGRLVSTSETFRSPKGEPLARRTTEYAASGYEPISRSEALASGETTDVRPVTGGIRVEHRKEGSRRRARSRRTAGSSSGCEMPGGGDERVEARLVHEGALPGIAP